MIDWLEIQINPKKLSGSHESEMRRNSMTETTVSKLSIVREALKKDPEVVVLGETIEIPDAGPWAELVNIIVAPKQPLRAADLLQHFMKELVAGLEPNQSDRFFVVGTILGFGKLYFDEEISGTLAAHARSRGRRIWVSVYPNVLVAALALQGQYIYSIELNTLLQYEMILLHLREALAK